MSNIPYTFVVQCTIISYKTEPMTKTMTTNVPELNYTENVENKPIITEGRDGRGRVQERLTNADRTVNEITKIKQRTILITIIIITIVIIAAKRKQTEAKRKHVHRHHLGTVLVNYHRLAPHVRAEMLHTV